MTEKLGPGVYITEDGSLHFDIGELLEAHGYADTPENRTMLTATAKEMAEREWPNVPVRVV